MVNDIKNIYLGYNLHFTKDAVQYELTYFNFRLNKIYTV